MTATDDQTTSHMTSQTVTDPLRPLTPDEVDAIEAWEAQATREIRPLSATLLEAGVSCEVCADEDRPAICTLAWNDSYSGESGEPYMCQECLDRDHQTIRLLAEIRQLQARQSAVLAMVGHSEMCEPDVDSECFGCRVRGAFAGQTPKEDDR